MKNNSSKILICIVFVLIIIAILIIVKIYFEKEDDEDFSKYNERMTEEYNKKLDEEKNEHYNKVVETLKNRNIINFFESLDKNNIVDAENVEAKNKIEELFKKHLYKSIKSYESNPYKIKDIIILNKNISNRIIEDNKKNNDYNYKKNKENDIFASILYSWKSNIVVHMEGAEPSVNNYTKEVTLSNDDLLFYW